MNFYKYYTPSKFMKLTTYPTFKRGEVQKKFKKFIKEDKKDIEDYVKYVSITSKSKKRLENNKRTLIQFRIITGKELRKITLKDLRNYLALLNNSNLTRATHNEVKASIKRFLKWKFKDWSQRFENLSDIKLKFGINEKKINAGTLLKKEELEAIMKKEHRTYWKAFFITLYESALRPIELRTITWDKINLNVDGNISEINIFATKTQRERSVYVDKATYYLKKLKETRKDNNPLVFPSPRDDTKPLNKNLVSMWLNNISKKAIGRKINPYLLRHTRATELYKKIPAEAQKVMGHSKDMREVYLHLNKDDVKKAMKKVIYNFEELPPEKKHELEKEIETLKELLKESETIQENKMKDLKEEMKELNSISKILIQELKKGKTK